MGSVDKCDCYKRIELISQQIKMLVDAMPRDELGNPSYEGHRKYHTAKNKNSEAVDEYLHEVTKKIIVYSVGGLIALISTGYSAELGNFLKVLLP